MNIYSENNFGLEKRYIDFIFAFPKCTLEESVERGEKKKKKKEKNNGGAFSPAGKTYSRSLKPCICCSSGLVRMAGAGRKKERKKGRGRDVQPYF